MGSGKVERTASDIKQLKIQGARNIAKAAVHAMASLARESKARTPDEFRSDLLVAADTLAKARPTEPMLQNSLRFFFAQLARGKPKSVLAARRAILADEKQLLAKFEASAERIAEYGAELLPAGATVLVHCHSSTLMGALKRAQEMGKKPVVFCTETRPRFQGRISARELAAAGIDTTLIVDSAVKSVMHKVDLVLVGADSITATGDLVNKIGTAGIADIAHAGGVNFLSCAELYKFDPLTIFGRATEIEMRSETEVADPAARRALKGVRILNYAFDRTPAERISAFITENGLVSPQGFAAMAMKELGLG